WQTVPSRVIDRSSPVPVGWPLTPHLEDSRKGDERPGVLGKRRQRGDRLLQFYRGRQTFGANRVGDIHQGAERESLLRRTAPVHWLHDLDVDAAQPRIETQLIQLCSHVRIAPAAADHRAV